ncbi:hypothetical protein TURU_132300 [Turdus rufiventris]|nr:hypothetical protein TURU_132300 [Turdus rufiventris]
MDSPVCLRHFATQLPPALDKYKSTYQKDFGWHDDYHSPIQAHVPKPSYPPVAELPKCYLPQCRSSELRPRRAGALALREPPSSDLLTYQQFAQDLYQERLYNADQNKQHNMNSSVLIQDSSAPDWKSVYQQDYQRRGGIPSELYTEEIRPSPVFPEENRFNESRWVTEYADSYSIFLKRLDWSSPIFGQWLPFGKDARWTPRWREPAH